MIEKYFILLDSFILKNLTEIKFPEPDSFGRLALKAENILRIFVYVLNAQILFFISILKNHERKICKIITWKIIEDVSVC